MPEEDSELKRGWDSIWLLVRYFSQSYVLPANDTLPMENIIFSRSSSAFLYWSAFSIMDKLRL
jgi:hypothetical protein